MTFTMPSNLLRLALIADAIASGVTGLLMFAGAALLTGLLGLPEELLRYAGLVLLPFAAFVAFIGTRTDIPRAAAGTVVVVNFAWVAASVALLVSGTVMPTMLGYAFVLAQALAVGVLAELQWIGLRRESRTA
ncbi:MAG TPA: hypothetical protein VFY21_02430 [Xanthobacteraceae bacterium]|nr:hypothetical protein [Xanthobacteraceae bacterium]